MKNIRSIEASSLRLCAISALLTNGKRARRARLGLNIRSIEYDWPARDYRPGISMPKRTTPPPPRARPRPLEPRGDLGCSAIVLEALGAGLASGGGLAPGAIFLSCRSMRPPRSEKGGIVGQWGAC